MWVRRARVLGAAGDRVRRRPPWPAAGADGRAGVAHMAALARDAVAGVRHGADQGRGLTQGTIGNSPRPPIRLPWLTNFDLTLEKNTQITERLRMQVHAAFFNSFKNPQSNGVALNFNNALFGRVTSAQDPPMVQIGLLFSF